MPDQMLAKSNFSKTTGDLELKFLYVATCLSTCPWIQFYFFLVTTLCTCSG